MSWSTRYSTSTRSSVPTAKHGATRPTTRASLEGPQLLSQVAQFRGVFPRTRDDYLRPQLRRTQLLARDSAQQEIATGDGIEGSRVTPERLLERPMVHSSVT